MGKTAFRHLPPEEALVKIQAYCAFQERCQQEVRTKLYEWGSQTKDVEAIIAQLIVDGFLNEERFARAYARGKFRIKGWGRRKITQELKRRNITDYCIRQGLKEIDQAEYVAMLKKILKKNKSSTSSMPLKDLRKTALYAISRGFEPELVWELLQVQE